MCMHVKCTCIHMYTCEIHLLHTLEWSSYVGHAQKKPSFDSPHNSVASEIFLSLLLKTDPCLKNGTLKLFLGNFWPWRENNLIILCMYRYELLSLQGHSKVNPWYTRANLARGGPPPSDKGLMRGHGSHRTWTFKYLLFEISEHLYIITSFIDILKHYGIEQPYSYAATPLKHQ